MKIVRALFAVALLFGSALADSPAPKKETPTKPAPNANEVPLADAEAFLAFYNKFVDLAVAAKDDCAKLTKDANALVDGNLALVKKHQENRNAGKQLPKEIKDKMLARVKELMPVMNKCGTNEGFQAAMKRIEGDKKAPPPAKAETAKPETKPETKPVKK
jgi:hypothetical protein